MNTGSRFSEGVFRNVLLLSSWLLAALSNNLTQWTQGALQ